MRRPGRTPIGASGNFYIVIVVSLLVSTAAVAPAIIWKLGCFIEYTGLSRLHSFLLFMRKPGSPVHDNAMLINLFGLVLKEVILLSQFLVANYCVLIAV